MAFVNEMRGYVVKTVGDIGVGVGFLADFSGLI